MDIEIKRGNCWNQAVAFTLLGLVEGDVLTQLERGEASVKRLRRAFDWPPSLVLMAIGSLIRKGLIAMDAGGHAVRLRGAGAACAV